MPMPPLLIAAALAGCSATDGDTLRCAPPAPGLRAERVRLLGIDAPELRGHCRRGRACAPGDPIASQAAMAQGLRLGPLSIVRLGYDRYGRTLGAVQAMTASGPIDLSCRQLRLGQAIYRPDWDNRRTIAARCPSLSSR